MLHRTCVMVDTVMCCPILFRNEELSPSDREHGQRKALRCEPPVWMPQLKRPALLQVKTSSQGWLASSDYSVGI